MSILALLHNLLKEKLPRIHATRLQALMATVEVQLSVCIDYGARAGALDLLISNTKSNGRLA